MSDLFFSSVIDGSMTAGSFIACTVASIILGALIALSHCYKSRYTPGFIVTLALIPVISQTIIMMVNGSVGAGVAVAGAFSLIRFRSIPGTAKEIGSIFLAMTVGIAAGMGYIGVAAVCAAVVILFGILYTMLITKKHPAEEKSLKITIPENLDYDGVFDDAFNTYTSSHELVRVKTVHMGSLFQLEYVIVLRESTREKAFIDELRCRNGNLDIVCGRIEQSRDEM